MRSLAEVDALEAQYRRPQGRPTLGAAYDALRERWAAGVRDRETALRLLFLAWYACAEAGVLTGLPEDGSTYAVFREVFAAQGGPTSDDPEFLLTAGYMADLHAFCIEWEREDEWEALGAACVARAAALGVAALGPEVFDGRGAYGDYFAHVARQGAW
jgi:hypothetical protein